MEEKLEEWEQEMEQKEKEKMGRMYIVKKEKLKIVVNEENPEPKVIEQRQCWLCGEEIICCRNSWSTEIGKIHHECLEGKLDVKIKIKNIKNQKVLNEISTTIREILVRGPYDKRDLELNTCEIVWNRLSGGFTERYISHGGKILKSINEKNGIPEYWQLNQL